MVESGEGEGGGSSGNVFKCFENECEWERYGIVVVVVVSVCEWNEGIGCGKG